MKFQNKKKKLESLLRKFTNLKIYNMCVNIVKDMTKDCKTKLLEKSIGLKSVQWLQFAINVGKQFKFNYLINIFFHNVKGINIIKNVLNVNKLSWVNNTMNILKKKVVFLQNQLQQLIVAHCVMRTFIQKTKDGYSI